MQKYFVLCATAHAVPGTLCAQQDTVFTIRYVSQKTEHTQAYEAFESFTFPGGNVCIMVPLRASTPCLISLPAPFNYCLKMGPTLLFQLPPTLDFVTLWNDCCAGSMTWQHNRPKKVTDPSQKLGLPPRLTDYLRDQVGRHGLAPPLGSDVSDDDMAVNDDTSHGSGSYNGSGSDTQSEAASNGTEEDYYSSLEEDDNEDLEEEEEVEDEPEPDELLEDE